MNYIFNAFNDIFDFAFDFYNTVNLHIPFWGTLIGLVFFYFIIKFVVYPFIGRAYSADMRDAVKEFRKSSGNGVSKKSKKSRGE